MSEKLSMKKEWCFSIPMWPAIRNSLFTNQAKALRPSTFRLFDLVLSGPHPAREFQISVVCSELQ